MKKAPGRKEEIRKLFMLFVSRSYETHYVIIMVAPILI